MLIDPHHSPVSVNAGASHGEGQRLTQELFVTAFHSSPIAFCVSRLGDGLILEANDSFAQLSGLSRAELLGQSIYRLYIWTDHDRYQQMVELARAGGRMRGFDFRLRSRSGAIRDGRLSLHTVEVAGQPCLITSVEDSSGRVQREDRLDFLVAIAESIEDAVVGFAHDGTILSWSPGAERMFGYSPARAIGRHISMLAAPANGEELWGLRERVRRGEPVKHSETKALRDDGRTFDISLSISPIRDRRGLVVGASYIARDISASKERERELLASEQRYRGLLDQASDAILICDSGGNYRDANAMACEMFGYSRQELLDLSVEDLLPAGELSRIAPHLEELCAGRTLRGELLVRRKDGTEFPVEVSTRLTSEGLLQSIVRDISTRQQAERERLARDTAERANQAKSEFLSRMSHELRAPLNAVLGFADMLGTEQLSPDQRESVEHIASAGKHLLNLINDVLDIARIEAGHMRLRCAPVHVAEVIQDSINLVRPSAMQRNLSISLALEGLEQYAVLADPQRLKQVLVNLLTNAVKYNHEGGAIVVSYQVASGRLRLLVKDSGQGIAPEKLDLLFTPFERLGAEHSEVEGAGLGLAITKELVEAMGGVIGVDSTAGAGSTFWIELDEARVDREVVQDLPAPDLPAVA